jgi:pimeloyl-ACP methyl ester carboxylesterase
MKTDPSQRLASAYDISTKVATLLQRRLKTATDRYAERLSEVRSKNLPLGEQQAPSPWDAWQQWSSYVIDGFQRSILFWDTLRTRGNNYIEHERAGKPPLLVFQHETIVDGRKLARPVNYALLRILPAQGVEVDDKKRPYVIIDPRAGHGPGIGGFKEDSEVGVALRAGHPVYVVIFFPEPEPNQTLLDVCEAEAQFMHAVRERHPESPKPVVMGNCQGGWAAMMLAASHPDDTGPIVVNGAPLSYWAGNFGEGEGENPMRYAGGLLGGSWLAALASDLGNGKFDGAHLVQNFENLNPANTFWDKYYHLYSKIDTEPARFLEFERWWGGYYLMNEAEIRWIVNNLFVGNKLAAGDVRGAQDQHFDLKRVRSPIIVFASMGDNITPPQQAFNWICDVYGSTEEVKANGQVIVGLVHGDVGHLGIFVSGKVAKKEHTQIVEVLRYVETLPPGLYAMKIDEKRGADGKPEYTVSLSERRLEDIRQAQRFDRKDEKVFDAVAAVSEFNERAYELFARPLVQAMTDETTARFLRDFHPLRASRWSWSDFNPMTWWLPGAAEAVRSARQQTDAANPWQAAEKAGSELLSASLDYYREVRDAFSEASFFQTYGNLFALGTAEQQAQRQAALVDARELPAVKQALAEMDHGGYREAVVRMLLLGRSARAAGQRVELDDIAEVRRILREAPDFQGLNADDVRRLLHEQSLIVEFARERALETLPTLLPSADERQRALALVDKVGAAANAGERERQMLLELHQRLGAVIKPVPSPREATPGEGVAQVRPPQPRSRTARAPDARGK